MIRLRASLLSLLALAAGQIACAQSPDSFGAATTLRAESHHFEPFAPPTSGFVPTAYFPSQHAAGPIATGYGQPVAPYQAQPFADPAPEASPDPSLDAPRPAIANAINNCDCGQPSPLAGMQVFFAYEAFRQITDGGWENNGLNAGINYAHSLGHFTEWSGFALQLGGSMGVYDWSGTDYRMKNQDQAETQGFFTYGLYHRATTESHWTAGLVHDWMLNTTFGVFAENPTLSQLRAQIGYEIGESDEVGMWAAVGVGGDTRDIPGFGPTRYEPVDQLNAYWHHHWQYGADTVIWFGIPEQSRLTGDGTLGDYIAGARVDSPLSDRVGAYASITHMHPSARPGPSAAQEDQWAFAVGVSYYFGRNAFSPSISGRRELPLLPVASNGLFMVDTNHWY